MRAVVPLLLSTGAFEEFYGVGLGLTRTDYLHGYRNDWSWEYAYALRNAGLRPCIYVASTGPSEHATTADGIEVRFLGLGRADGPWQKYRVLRRTPFGRYVQQVASARSLLPELRTALRADRAAALLVQEYWTGRWDVLSRLRLPLIAIDQGMPERRELKLLKSATLPTAKAIVVQTSVEAAKVAGYGGVPVRIPNGVDIERYRPAGDDGGPERHGILIVARLLDVQKRVSDLLRAVALLGDEWTLRVMGSGPDEAELRALAAELGIHERCRFDGFVMDRDLVAGAMRDAAVFALPSAYEGLPMALLEAMASGCAVVGSDIPAIAEVIEDGRTGLIVTVGDVEGLAAAIEAAGSRLDALGAAARSAIVSEYSRARMGERLAELVLT